MQSPVITRSLQRQRLLQGRLYDAEDDHDDACRERFAGVTGKALDADKARWEEIGGAIASLARLVSGHCASSQFCHARPQADLLAVRFSEAIDDQLDGTAWAVADAAARADVARKS